MSANIMMAKINGVEGRIGYHFQNSLLVWEALQAPDPSRPSIGGHLFPDGNKRLAVLGDTALQLALCDNWFASGANKGRFDQIRLEVASNRNLDRIGRLHGIDAFINPNPSQRGDVSFNLMTATVEGILGAVLLDSDLQTVKQVMVTLGLVPT